MLNNTLQQMKDVGSKKQFKTYNLNRGEFQ